MKQYSILLFDLDGTLTESGEGIIRSVQYALEKFDIQETNPETLSLFIGPPLLDSFQRIYGMSAEDARAAVRFYRERFSTIGIFENQVYPGIEEMLKELKRKGVILAVASSKPETFVVQIMQHFHLEDCFCEVVGSLMNETRTGKPEVIEEALRRLDALDRREEVLMIGDTEHDVLGAKNRGIDCLAVNYGYGTEDSIRNAGPIQVVDTVSELRRALETLAVSSG